MKKQRLFLLAAMIMTIYAPLSASDHVEAIVYEVPELSNDQKVFVSKLSDENRNIFINLENEQKEAIITAANNGLAPDEAVQHLIESKNIENCSVDFLAE
ncbi:MAG: hypothetical protein ACRDAI_01525 [Candidatus Rhabdochlamydia sp.]